MKDIMDGVTIKNSAESFVSGTMPHLQSEYGDANNCTLVSIATVIEHLLNEHTQSSYSFSEIYKNVLNGIKPKFAYSPKYGTISLFNKNIAENVLESYLDGCNFTTQGNYIKGLGYDYELIKDVIDSGFPAYLYARKADKYKNHTMVIIGYREYMNVNKKWIRQLIVYDNWSKREKNIDYSSISFISMIGYIEKNIS